MLEQLKLQPLQTATINSHQYHQYIKYQISKNSFNDYQFQNRVRGKSRAQVSFVRNLYMYLHFV